MIDRFLAVIAALWLGVIPATAEPIDFFEVSGATFDPAYPTPDEFLGHGLGDQPVRHDQMVAYLTAIAEQSPRITAETIGRSHEGRPIQTFVITAPDNHARLEEIRARHLARLTGGGADTNAPVVIWLNYGVHGAESSAMDAALPALYHLAAAQGPEIERELRESVIIFTAVYNPDGHARRIDHVLTYKAQAPVLDTDHIQHDLWTKARTNHYWFDLNRQWLLQTQPEPQAWMAKWHYWKPNVTIDFHEMGSESNYYFHPGEPNREFVLNPDRARDLITELSGYHADRLDEMGELYTRGEGFDNFYVGKGSTYPAVNGGIGVLFEAAAARGGQVQTSNGVRTFAENIRLHYNTSLTSIAGAVEMREDLLAYQREFFAQAAQNARSSSTKAYVFGLEGDQARLNIFADLLRRNGIEVRELTRDIRANGRTYRAGHAYIVPLAQPSYLFVRALFERFTEFEENVFYDVSAWTLPLMTDINYAPVSGRAFNANLLGPQADPGMAPQSAPAPARSDYGYLFDWSEYYAPRALHRLLDADVIARVAFDPGAALTTNGERAFDRGAIFVPLIRQDASADEIYDLVQTIASEDGVEVHALTSGRATPVDFDLGARRTLRTLSKPRVLLAIEDGVSSYDAGEVWHLLDYRMRMPVFMRRKSQLDDIDLTDFTHLILVGGASGLDEEMAERVGDWVTRQGGVVIGVRQGAEWVQDKLLKASEEDKDNKDENEADEGAEQARQDYASMSLRDAQHIIGGALFAGDLDITHPLGFGFKDRNIASLRNTQIKLDTPKDPYATVVRYTDAPLLSGYASERRIEELAGSPMMVAERKGDGAVVLFVDNPNFRGITYGTNKLFLNALFFATLIDTPNLDENATHHE